MGSDEGVFAGISADAEMSAGAGHQDKMMHPCAYSDSDSAALDCQGPLDFGLL
jgi:hypothetical protein